MSMKKKSNDIDIKYSYFRGQKMLRQTAEMLRLVESEMRRRGIPCEEMYSKVVGVDGWVPVSEWASAHDQKILEKENENGEFTMNDMQVAGGTDQIIDHIKEVLIANMRECADELVNAMEAGSIKHSSSRCFNLLCEWECRMSRRVGERSYIVAWEIVLNGDRILKNSTGIRGEKECSGLFIEKVMVRDAIKCICNFNALENRQLLSAIEQHQMMNENPATAPCRSNSL